MAKPTRTDRAFYPLLSARETWPPPRAPQPGMTPPERAELIRYHDDQRTEQLHDERRRQYDADTLDRLYELEEVLADPPESDREPDQAVSNERDQDQSDDRPWYERNREALREPQFQVEPPGFLRVEQDKSEMEFNRVKRQQERDYQKELKERAIWMLPTKAERQLLREAKRMSHTAEYEVRQQIADRKEAQLRAKDHERYQRKIMPERDR